MQTKLKGFSYDNDRKCDNRQFKKIVFDKYLIHKVGTDEAYDLPEKDYEYEETDELLPKDETFEEIDVTKVYN